ncbi:hypothetical protein I5677_01470 [Mobilitalea sibirica]|uniref:Uncharacterized protein n=1 Tax=Mobilitalea sibirica TaxID=1462919 RepID=A0A8J7HBS4_9FIRM|nr:hypothetical protein [Mobilitalea sibirica]MBH1939559.1 hypothetical protein [Mobilitalea sibirica]
MSNVFKKLISKELGEVNYNRYFSFVKRNVDTKMSDSQIIFNDMYEKLKYRDLKALTKMHDRLNDTMLLAFRISKTYFFAFVFYLGVSIFLIARAMAPEITIGALVLMNLCFVYKTYEFVANKFCYIDAQIVLVYKAVLDRIILNQRRSMMSKR